MSALQNAAQTIHSLVIVLFVAATVMLLAIEVVRRARYRRVYTAWSTGRLFGIPLAPTVFLVAVVGLLTFRWTAVGPLAFDRPLLVAGYLGGGLFWYISSLLCHSVIVTDWGVTGASSRVKRLPWHSVIDYVTREDGRNRKYVFFLLNSAGRKIRTELVVPRSNVERFHHLVRQKLDARFNYHVQRPLGEQAMEQ